MSDLKICRICVRTKCKMYHYSRSRLKLTYEEIMASKIDEKDCLPQYFCYECATMLCKFRKFKEKCFVGQNFLKNLKWKEGITCDTVESNCSGIKKYICNISILKMTKRIKTYWMTHRTHDTAETDRESTKDNESINDSEDNKMELECLDIVNEDSTGFDNDNLIMEMDPVDPEPEFEVKTDPIEEPIPSVLDVKIEKRHEEPQEFLKQILNSKLKVKSRKLFVDIVKKNDKEKTPSKSTTEKKPYKRRKRASKNWKEDFDKSVDFEPDNFSKYGLKEKNPAFSRKKKRILSGSHWKRSTLSEEQVIINLKNKAADPKYVAAEFKCTGCVKWFREEDILKRHKQLRHNEASGTLECRFCHMRFRWDCHLRKHLRSHFTKFECQRCDLVCSLESTALLHEDYHNGVIKKCGYCNLEFKHSSTYYTHLRTHRSKYLCRICGMSFVSELGLIMHKKVKHVSEQAETQDDDENTFCEKCNIRFETKKAYEEHIFQSALHTEGIEADFNVFEDLQGDDESDDKPLAKVGNEKKLKLARQRKRPLRIKHRKPMSCHHCGKHFNSQKDCMKHHLAEHRGKSFYPESDKLVCEICGVLLAPGSVAMHLNTHTKERLHSCETCGRQFNTSVSLKRHQVTHTGEKKYPCPLCDKRFTQNNSMKLHYRTYHLKEPYPKRNRRKKEVLLEAHDSASEGECPRAAPRPNPHYYSLG